MKCTDKLETIRESKENLTKKHAHHQSLWDWDIYILKSTLK